jgi:hypothetical protein
MATTIRKVNKKKRNKKKKRRKEYKRGHKYHII